MKVKFYGLMKAFFLFTFAQGKQSFLILSG
jgi:hypothetical protein